MSKYKRKVRISKKQHRSVVVQQETKTIQVCFSGSNEQKDEFDRVELLEIILGINKTCQR